MSRAFELIREALALPPERRREALLPLYRAAYATYGRDWRANTAAMADEFEFHAGGSGWPPGMARTLYGREGYLEAHRHMLEHLEVRGIEVDDLLMAGERRVVALLRFVVVAGGGTIDQHVLDVHDFREDGALVRQTVYFDVDEGRQQLGLGL